MLTLTPKQIYNSARWAKLRTAQLAREPLCRACFALDMITAATDADHIVPLSQGGEAFPPLHGLQSLCITCHQLKTATERRDVADVTGRRLPGIGLDGSPVCQNDNWHQKVIDAKRQPGPKATPDQLGQKELSDSLPYPQGGSNHGVSRSRTPAAHKGIELDSAKKLTVA